MNQKRIIRYFILIYWVFFEALTVIDKIIPDVTRFWVGADFYTLFIKLFASLGLTHPIYATVALALTALGETAVLVLFLLALYNLYRGRAARSEYWFDRGVALSVLIFSFFSIGDQVFGDRSNLLEHGIFVIILIVSWAIFKYGFQIEERIARLSLSRDLKVALLAGFLLTVVTSYSILDFAEDTFPNKSRPVTGKEVVPGMYKFDFPFLADKRVLEKTLMAFEKAHPDLRINYIYTAPDELKTKKKTHMLLYILTERKR